MFSSFLPPVTALAFLIAPCFAQEPGDVTLRFLSFPQCDEPHTVELLIGEGQTITVEIPSNDLSVPYQVKRLATWSVGQVDVIKGDEGEGKVFTSYGQAPSIASDNQLILLIREGKENSDGIRVIPLDIRLENFGGGQFLFFNASRLGIEGKLAGEDISLKPGSLEIIKPAGGVLVHEGNKSAFAELSFRKNDVVKPFFSSIWPVNDFARSIIFIYQETDNERLRFHSIRFFHEPNHDPG